MWEDKFSYSKRKYFIILNGKNNNAFLGHAKTQPVPLNIIETLLNVYIIIYEELMHYKKHNTCLFNI